MNVLVIGDVHGCYHTLRQLLKSHFTPDDTLLVQVGDLINKGPHSGRCIRYWQKLENKYPGQVFMVRGNHEQFIIDAFNQQKSNKTVEAFLKSLQRAELEPEETVAWLRRKPLSWQNPQMFVTHAGISARCNDPFHTNVAHSVITNRHALMPLNQVQVVGHTVTKSTKPFFSTKENAWYLDTGAYLGNHLSALLFTNKNHPRVIQIATDGRDVV